MTTFEYYRKRANLTRRKVTDKFGLNRTTIAKWEKGASLPRAELLPKIAEFYNCTTDDLLQDDLAPQPDTA